MCYICNMAMDLETEIAPRQSNNKLYSNFNRHYPIFGLKAF